MELRPLQKECVEKMLHFLRTNPANGVYNASVRGTGKSAMTVGVINQLKPDVTLIICPAIVKLNWQDELKTWLNYEGSFSIWVINKSAEIKNQKGLSTFTIINYELARIPKVAKWISEQPIDLLVLDECHKVAKTKAKTTKEVLRTIWPKTKYRICLSGTPFTHSILDCYTIFSRLNPSAFPDYFKFADTYAFREITPWGPQYYGLKNHEKLKSIIRKSFFLRYTKEEMAEEIPPVQWCKVLLGSEYAVKETTEDIENYQQYLKLLEDAIGKGKALPFPPKHLQTKRREQGLNKLPFIIEFVKELLENNEPTIVGFVYLECLHKFVSAFKENNPSVIYGSISSDDRYKEIKKFQEGETNLFIGQIHAMNTGINLQKAKNVLLAELDYSPAIIDQFIGRSDRIGRTTSVNAYYFVTEGTLEEDIVRVVLSKNRVFNKVLCDKENS